jgi:hypothetical protein
LPSPISSAPAGRSRAKSLADHVVINHDMDELKFEYLSPTNETINVRVSLFIRLIDF